MILVTGGAGYIGSHCVLSLIEKGFEVVILDNLSTGHIETVDRLKEYGKIDFFKADLLDKETLEKVFLSKNIDAVIHFAALSQVSESVKNPQKYYTNNVLGSKNILDVMVKNNVKKIVFSSTASIYGEPQYVPIDENHPKKPINPYGETKLEIEKLMGEYDKKYGLKSIRLRYFNVVGTDTKIRIGEWHEPETHLIPNILKSTFDKGKVFELYGDDYKTKDGTCIRDYVNVQDLVQAHILALEYLNRTEKTDYFNIGTNEGSSVKEVFAICEEVTNCKIPVKIMPRREGDPAKLIADNKKAKEILNWTPQYTLKDSIETAYLWEKFNQNDFFQY